MALDALFAGLFGGVIVAVVNYLLRLEEKKGIYKTEIYGTILAICYTPFQLINMEKLGIACGKAEVIGSERVRKAIRTFFEAESNSQERIEATEKMLKAIKKDLK